MMSCAGSVESVARCAYLYKLRIYFFWCTGLQGSSEARWAAGDTKPKGFRSWLPSRASRCYLLPLLLQQQ